MVKFYNHWKSTPRPLKALVILLITNLVFTPIFFLQGKYFFVGFVVLGTPAVLLKAFLNIIAPLALVVALARPYPWGWKFGLGYYGFFFINSILALTVFLVRLPSALYTQMLSTIIVGAAAAVLNGVFLAIIFKHREYFSRNA